MSTGTPTQTTRANPDSNPSTYFRLIQAAFIDMENLFQLLDHEAEIVGLLLCARRFQACVHAPCLAADKR